MFWFIIPVIVVAVIVAIAVWVIAANVRRRGGDGVPEPGQTVYDADEQKKSPDAPPA